MGFFQISTSSVSQILATMATLFDNVAPLIWIIVALSVGVWIVSALLGVMRQEKELGDWWETDPFLNEADRVYYRRKKERQR